MPAQTESGMKAPLPSTLSIVRSPLLGKARTVAMRARVRSLDSERNPTKRVIGRSNNAVIPCHEIFMHRARWCGE